MGSNIAEQHKWVTQHAFTIMWLMSLCQAISCMMASYISAQKGSLPLVQWQNVPQSQGKELHQRGQMYYMTELQDAVGCDTATVVTRQPCVFTIISNIQPVSLSLRMPSNC